MSVMPDDLTAERVPDGVKYTKTLPDGTKHSATMYVFPKDVFDRLQACVAVNQAKREHDNKWWRKMLRKVR